MKLTLPCVFIAILAGCSANTKVKDNESYESAQRKTVETETFNIKTIYNRHISHGAKVSLTQKASRSEPDLFLISSISIFVDAKSSLEELEVRMGEYLKSLSHPSLIYVQGEARFVDDFASRFGHKYKLELNRNSRFSIITILPYRAYYE